MNAHYYFLGNKKEFIDFMIKIEDRVRECEVFIGVGYLEWDIISAARNLRNDVLSNRLGSIEQQILDLRLIMALRKGWFGEEIKKLSSYLKMY